MRIALAQTYIEWENKQFNIRKAADIVMEQVIAGTELILFPEMSFSGFSMNTRATGERDMETVNRMSLLAMNHTVAIGFGWVRWIGDKCENVYSILDKNGKVISEYVKIHPFSYSGEDEKFSGGEKITLFDYEGVRCSNFICYDLRFPELFRLVADDVHVIIVPANWPAKRAEHWKTLLRARAIENQVYIFGINCQGNIGGLYYSGDSCVINPNGDVIEMLSDSEGVITYDFSDDVEEYREAFPVLKDRKSKLYSLIGKGL